jgi:glycosyltransferase involved in cell wall biosynthesis
MARTIALAAAEERRVSVISLTAPEFADERDPALPVHHVVTRGGYGMAGDYLGLAGLGREVLRAVKRDRPEVAHLVGAPLALAPLLRARGVRVVAHVMLTQHSYASRLERARARLGRLWDPAIAALAPAAEPVLADLVARGHDPRRVVLVPPPLDTAHFASRGREAARAELGLDADAFTVVYVGTISPLRFPAPEVAAGLAGDLPGGRRLALEVFAPVRTHEYNRAWADENVGAAMRAADVDCRVHLEDLTDERKALVFSAADAVILPFSAPVAVEPPLTLLESMACEAIPVVAPAANRSRVVLPGENGFGFATPDELRAAIARVAGLGADERAALGARARADVEGRFGRVAVAAALDRLWTVALGGDPDPSAGTAPAHTTGARP